MTGGAGSAHIQKTITNHSSLKNPRRNPAAESITNQPSFTSQQNQGSRLGGRVSAREICGPAQRLAGQGCEERGTGPDWTAVSVGGGQAGQAGGGHLGKSPTDCTDTGKEALNGACNARCKVGSILCAIHNR